jgi:hypothetical protein
MSIQQIVKKSFKEQNRTNEDFNPPLLYRQVATQIIYDDNMNLIYDSSHEINNYYRQKSYFKECLKECLKKYNNYKCNKKIYYSIKMFKKMIDNKLPIEIIIEIINYLY